MIIVRPIVNDKQPEIITETVEVENVIIQDNMLNRLIDEPGINFWNISSYEDDTSFYLTVEFDFVKDTKVKLQRKFKSPMELNENINLILEEARSLK